MQRSRACLQSCGGADGFVSIQDRTLGDRDDSRGRYRKSAVDHTNLWCVVMGSLESRFLSDCREMQTLPCTSRCPRKSYRF